MRRLLRLLATGLVAALALTTPTIPAHAAANIPAANKAAVWLASNMASDGSLEAGFGGPVDGTAESLIGLAAATDASLQPKIDAMLAYLKANAATYGAKPVGAAKLAIVAGAFGHNVDSYFGVNATQVITAAALPDGTFGKGTFGDSWILVGLKRAGGTVTTGMCNALVAQQDVATGAFGYVYNGFNADTDTTGLALMALTTCSTPSANAAATHAAGYLASIQQGNGQWANPYSPVNTTALAAMGMTASGASQDKALAWLLSQQDASGGMLYQGSTDLYATAQALPILAGRTYLTVAWSPTTVTPTPTVTATATATATTTARVTVRATTVRTVTRTVVVTAPAVTATATASATPTETASPAATPSAAPVTATSGPTPTAAQLQPTAQGLGGSDAPWYVGGGVMLLAALVGGAHLMRKR